MVDGLVNLNDTGTKVLPSSVDLGVAHPVVLVLPLLGSRVPVTGSETPGVGPCLSALVEDVMSSLNFGIKGGYERLIADGPVSIGRCAIRAFGSRNSNAPRRASWRGGGQLLVVGFKVLLLLRRHVEVGGLYRGGIGIGVVESQFLDTRIEAGCGERASRVKRDDNGSDKVGISAGVEVESTCLDTVKMGKA